MKELEKAKRLLVKDRKIIAAYLFGSRTRKRARSRDTDIALLLDEKYRSRFFDLSLDYKNSLESLLGSAADVVILNTADPLLRFQVYSKGIPIFLRSAKKASAFHIQSLYKYWDFLPLKRMLEEKSISRLLRHARRY